MKSYHLVIQPIVRSDVDEIADHIAETSTEQAFRFYDAFGRTLATVISWPGPLARPRLRPGHPTKGEVRRWNIEGFRNHTLIYDVRDDAVVILRCVHGSRITGEFFDTDT